MLLWDSVRDSNLGTISAESSSEGEKPYDLPTDCALTECPHPGQLEAGQRLAHVGLGDSQLDPPLLEPLGEGF